MKLRNKKTREIREARIIGEHLQLWEEVLNDWVDYDDIDYLAEHWERCEEPKEYWTIDWSCTGVTTNRYSGDDIDDFNKSIGNYFETKEEAEKAVEKLKAWKRLKDARFEFGSIKYNLDEKSSNIIAYDGIITIKGMAYEDFVNDLDLLFGGEE